MKYHAVFKNESSMLRPAIWKNIYQKHYESQDFPGGPVVGTHLPMQWVPVGSLVGELRSHKTLGQKTKT